MGLGKWGRSSKQKLTRHRMFTKDGELVATCVQEVMANKDDHQDVLRADKWMQGVVRLKERDVSSKL